MISTGETILNHENIWQIRNFRNRNPFTDYLQGKLRSIRLIPHVPYTEGKPEHENRSSDGWSFPERKTRQAG